MIRLAKEFCAPVSLGQGGEASVYLCWQKDPGRWVVLKIANASGAGRLRREAKLLEHLAGGPVPALLGQDLTCRHPWLALTWIDGIPLDSLPESITTSDRRAIIIQASLAAARLHGAMLVHADLSAANLIARPHGEVGVVDFGLSPLPGSTQVPSIEGAWEILPPERLQGASPDPRWDVFALGVIGAKLLGALPSEVGSRDEWTFFVASGEAAKSARGRSWALSLALDPDPAVRPADAAALVRLLEKEWGDPPFSRDLFARESAIRLERMLARAVHLAESRSDWDSAWRLQRERIERATDPEPLLAKLGEFQRKRRNPPGRIKWWILFWSCVLIAIGLAIWLSRKSEDKPSNLEPAANSVTENYGEFEPRGSSAGVLVFDPPPPGSRLEIDGKNSVLPPDGFLSLSPGTRHVVLLDSAGDEILDTTLIVPRSGAKHAKNRKDSGPSVVPKDTANKKVRR